MQDKNSDRYSIILFDGVCNLCNNAVQFVIKKDKKNNFRFASLQSPFGQDLLKQFQLDTKEFNSFIVVEKGKIYNKSTAALRVAKKLAGLWPLLYFFIVVPAFIRNYVYDFIAANRYKWFGKKDACWVPTPELKMKFLDQV